MAVYIDDFNYLYGPMLMCHMMADTTDELLEMVDKIGVKRKWIQYPGTPKEHFDICLTKKKKAIALGAIEVTSRELAEMARLRRQTGKLGSPPDRLTQPEQPDLFTETL